MKIRLVIFRVLRRRFFLAGSAVAFASRPEYESEGEGKRQWQATFIFCVAAGIASGLSARRSYGDNSSDRIRHWRVSGVRWASSWRIGRRRRVLGVVARPFLAAFFSRARGRDHN